MNLIVTFLIVLGSLIVLFLGIISLYCLYDSHRKPTEGYSVDSYEV